MLVQPTASVTILILTTLLTFAASIAILSIESVYATNLTKGQDTSGLTLGEELKSPGWDANITAENAQSQEAEGQHCIGCAKDFSPGQQ